MENRPTLEEIKEYFKGAEECASVQGTKFKNKEAYWNDLYLDTCEGVTSAYIKHGSFEVWNSWQGYAKILSYKEPKEKTYKITKEQILELDITLHKERVDYLLKEWFPEAFKTELVVGKWYWRYGKRELAVWNEGKLTYGFNSSFQFLEHYSFTDIDADPTEATNQEVEEALKGHAISVFKDSKAIDNSNISSLGGVYKISDKLTYKYWELNNMFTIDDVCVFKDGIWAVPFVATYTKQEAEDKFNIKIV